MGVEVDFLAVGDETQSGDAIALRYGNLHGARTEQTVIVIDGGFADSGKSLIDLIRKHYKTDRVDVVVASHPDQDHISGLREVLEQLTVGQLWMHQPWKHSHELSEARKSNYAWASLSEAVQKSLQGASDLEALANENGVAIVEPFLGVSTPDKAFFVLGPTQEYYETILAGLQTQSSSFSLSDLLRKASEAAASLVPETIHIETLRDGGVTQPQNNTSVISYLEVDERKYLFTGDAGIPALENALDILETAGFAPGTLGFVQIPHHGSRRNVGPTVLNRLLGEKGQETPHSTAYVSAAKKWDKKHPAKKVTNAFRRRGYSVVATQGVSIRHYKDAPDREGYGPVDPVPFYDQVEDYED